MKNSIIILLNLLLFLSCLACLEGDEKTGEPAAVKDGSKADGSRNQETNRCQNDGW